MLNTAHFSSSDVPLYSRKLHIRVRLDNTSCVTSLMILALSFGDKVVNHLARRYRKYVGQHKYANRRVGDQGRGA
jgi:hypothetical protein